MQTDDFSDNVVLEPVGMADINNTILHCLGVDNNRLTVKYQGLDARVTGVAPFRLLQELLQLISLMNRLTRSDRLSL